MSSSLFVITGNFSGSGKTTIQEAALQRFPTAKKVLTCTTRPKRAQLGEMEGVHYHFLTKPEFTTLLEHDAFAEYKQNFEGGNWYGVLHRDIQKATTGNIPAFIVVELQGVRSLQEHYPDAHYVFVAAPTDEIRKRLIARGDAPEDIEKRMQMINNEYGLLGQVRIDCTIVNKDGALDKAIEEFCAFVTLNMTGSA